MIAWINHWASQWAAYFGMIVVQNTIFLGLIFLALYMLRNASARIRYTITAIGLIKCFLPPMFPLPILKSISTSQPQIIAGSSVAIQPMITVQPLPIQSPSITINIIGLIFLTWILLTEITLMIPLISTLRLKSKLRNSVPVDSNIDLLIPSIQIYKNDFIGMPLTMGLFSKKIYVPAHWDHWSPEWQKMVLNHEMAHIQRRDSLMKLFQMIAQALYFFHPLIWAINRKMNELREMACDDRSTSGEMNSSIEYSHYLVEIAETMKQTQLGCTSASALIRKKNELYNRVHYQTREVPMNKNIKRKIALVIGGLLLLCIPLSSYDRSTDSTSSDINPIQNNTVSLSINAEGIVKLNEEEIEIHMIKDQVSTLLEENPKLVVSLRFDNNVNMKIVTDIQEELMKAGALKVNYHAESSLSSFDSSNNSTESKMDKELGMTLPSENTWYPARDIVPILIRSEGAVMIDEEPIEIHSIKDRITARFTENPQLVALIRTDVNTKYQSLIFVLDQVQMAMGESPRIVIAEPRDSSQQQNDSSPSNESLTSPPPSQEVDENTPVFIPYNEPPMPIGGYASIQQQLIYPEVAKMNRIEGRVIIQAQISEEGDVVRTVIMESLDPACDSTAMEAIKAIKWKPAIQRDAPVKVWITIPVDFTLKQEDSKLTDESLAPPPSPLPLQEIDEDAPVLFQNHPNPFDSTTQISYSLPKKSTVQIEIIDESGQKIRVFAIGEQSPGDYTIIWDGKDDSGKNIINGLYTCRLKTGTLVQTKRMLLLNRTE